VATSILTFLFSYLIRIILARSLTAAEYGLFYAVFAFLNLISIAKDFGLYYALVKFIPEFLHKKSAKEIKESIITVSRTIFLFYAPVAIILFLLAPWLATNYFKSEEAVWVIRILCLIYLTAVFENTTVSTYHGFQRFGFVSAMSLSKSFFLLSIIYIGILAGFPALIAAASAYVISPLLIFMFFFPNFIRSVFPEFRKIKASFSVPVLKKFLAFGIPMILALMGNSLLVYSQTAILTIFVTLEQVGLYNIALPTANLLTFFETAFITVLVPMVSELWAKNDNKRIEAGLEMIYRYIIIFLLPLVLVMVSYPDFIISKLYGIQYVGASMTLVILSLAAIFWTMASINFSTLIALNRTKAYSKIIFSGAIVNTIFCFVLIPYLGIIGAAISTMIINIFMLIFSFLEVRKYLALHFPVMHWLKSAVFGLVFLAVIYLIKPLFYSWSGIYAYAAVAITIIISMLVYFALVFLLGVMKLSEIKYLIKLLIRKN
jgi:O-antigen/teichoic acid export membrane protein